MTLTWWKPFFLCWLLGSICLSKHDIIVFLLTLSTLSKVYSYYFSISSQSLTIQCSIGYLRLRIPIMSWAWSPTQWQLSALAILGCSFLLFLQKTEDIYENQAFMYPVPLSMIILWFSHILELLLNVEKTLVKSSSYVV